MKLSCIYRALQASALASATLLMLPAGAQTTTTTDTPATTGTTAEQAIRATTRAQNRAQGIKPKHHTAPRHSRTNRNNRNNDYNNSAGEPANANRLATDRAAMGADYERNAMARCEVFKTQEQSMACKERMRQTPQGSVEGGGLLWEYSYQVPANGS